MKAMAARTADERILPRPVSLMYALGNALGIFLRKEVMS